jgi:hypothetical protein
MGCVEKKFIDPRPSSRAGVGKRVFGEKKEALAKANRLAKGLNTGSRVSMGNAGGLGFGGIGVCVFRGVGCNTLAFLKICHVRQMTYKGLVKEWR